MDGFKRLLNASIQVKLSLTLSLAILVVAVVAGIFSFMAAFDEAHELQDDTLRQVAALFNRQHLQPERLADNKQVNDGDEESRIIVQLLADGAKASLQPDMRVLLPIPTTLIDGMHALDLSGEPFQVFVKTTALGERIAVAQETGVRDEIARNSALRTLMPFLILIPILLLIVADLVRKMFRPITELAKEIDQRSEQALHPVAGDHLPIEIRPFVVAINRLLTRVDQSMEVQRRFVADAAHELRSPLTAMCLQAERLADTPMPDQARERLFILQRGIERGRKLLDQLLTLAKAQATSAFPQAPISVQAVYRRVLEDLLPLAEAKHIDVGVEGTQDAQVMVSELDMVAVVKNLVDNAIRYTPEGGKVDLSVSIRDHQAIVQIKDSGPGIAVDERKRVFDPFYRTLGSDQVGSGLGLSIVKTIADRIGAEIELGFSDEMEGTGLLVRILMPM
jgi:two-component system OmpR family sensor kinase